MNDIDFSAALRKAHRAYDLGHRNDRRSTYEGLQNAYVPPEVLRLRRAQKIAAEVRARHPEMQVRKVAP